MYQVSGTKRNKCRAALLKSRTKGIVEKIAKLVQSYQPSSWQIVSWEGDVTEYTCPISKNMCPNHETLVKYLHENMKLQLLSSEEYERIMIDVRPRLAELKRQQEEEDRKREAAKKAALLVPDITLIERVFAKEHPILSGLVPLPFGTNKPTLVQALERGCALCPKIVGVPGKVLQKERDGSYSASLLGALYVGCVGLERIDSVLLDANAVEKNTSCMKMLEVIKNTIRYWRKSSGQYRRCGEWEERWNTNSPHGGKSSSSFHSFEWLLLSNRMELDDHPNTKGFRLLYRDHFARIDRNLEREKERDHQKYLHATS